MRTLLIVSLAVVSLSACQDKPSSASSAPGSAAPAAAVKAPRAVMGTEAKAAIAKGATLVDVRTVEEFAELHIPGAVNIPLDELFDRKSAIPKDRPVVVYCAVGSRASVAAAVLAKSGYDVMDLGGMGNWNR